MYYKLREDECDEVENLAPKQGHRDIQGVLRISIYSLRTQAWVTVGRETSSSVPLQL